MATVAVTGASGFLGAHVLGRFSRSPGIDRLVAVDNRKPGWHESGKIRFFAMDVRDPAVADLFVREGVDTVLHLAFVVSPLRDAKATYDIDINGSRNVLQSAAACGVKKIVFSSSSSVYGFHADSPVPLHETHPLRPNEDNIYAVHKTRVEALLAEIGERHKNITISIFRPCMILGPHMDNFSCRMARSLSRIITIKNHNPLLQFVHEDDVAEAFLHAVRADMPGTFNLVGSGTVDMRRFCELFDKPCVQIPYGPLYALAKLLWTMRVPGFGFSPGWLSILRYSCIASGKKLSDMYSFEPSYSTLETLQSYIQEHAAQ